MNSTVTQWTSFAVKPKIVFKFESKAMDCNLVKTCTD